MSRQLDFGCYAVCPHDRNPRSEVQLPLRRKPERHVDAGKRGVGFDPFGRSLLDAWTTGIGIAVKKLDLAQGLVGSSPVPFSRSGRSESARTGPAALTTPTTEAQRARLRSGRLSGEYRAHANFTSTVATNPAHLIAARFLQKVSRLFVRHATRRIPSVMPAADELKSFDGGQRACQDSLDVRFSIAASSSAPMRTITTESQIQVMKPTTAPKEP